MAEAKVHTDDPMLEELPQHQDIAQQRDLVSDQKLSAHGPPKEAEVAWVSQPAIYSVRHELMALPLRRRGCVIEIGPCLAHGGAPDHLANNDEGDATQDGILVDERCLIVRKQEGGYHYLGNRQTVGNIISHPVGKEEEARGSQCDEVVSGRGLVLEEVKDAETSDEC